MDIKHIEKYFNGKINNIEYFNIDKYLFLFITFRVIH